MNKDKDGKPAGDFTLTTDEVARIAGYRGLPLSKRRLYELPEMEASAPPHGEDGAKNEAGEGEG